MRKLIASLLDSNSDTLVRQTYFRIFKEPCRVRTLHLTFIPPFNTEDAHLNFISSSLKSLPPLPEVFAPKPLNLFDHSRKILYLPLTPLEPLSSIYENLLSQIKPLVTFDSPDFPINEIPPFLPHITLNYDYLLADLPNSPFPPISLSPPNLLHETAPGIWQPLT